MYLMLGQSPCCNNPDTIYATNFLNGSAAGCKKCGFHWSRWTTSELYPLYTSEALIPISIWNNGSMARMDTHVPADRILPHQATQINNFVFSVVCQRFGLQPFTDAPRLEGTWMDYPVRLYTSGYPQLGLSRPYSNRTSNQGNREVLRWFTTFLRVLFREQLPHYQSGTLLRWNYAGRWEQQEVSSLLTEALEVLKRKKFRYVTKKILPMVERDFRIAS